MGIVCENCGWRRNPNDNTGRGCIFTNTKKVWNYNQYNKACNNYIMDTELKEHLRKLLGIKPNEQTKE